jgi:hypothetical protein
MDEAGDELKLVGRAAARQANPPFACPDSHRSPRIEADIEPDCWHVAKVGF